MKAEGDGGGSRKKCRVRTAVRFRLTWLAWMLIYLKFHRNWNWTKLNFSQWITRCCFTVNVASLSTRPWQEVIKSRALRVIKFQNKSRVVCRNVIRRQMISFSCHLISLASLFFWQFIDQRDMRDTSLDFESIHIFLNLKHAKQVKNLNVIVTNVNLWKQAIKASVQFSVKDESREVFLLQAAGGAYLSSITMPLKRRTLKSSATVDIWRTTFTTAARAYMFVYLRVHTYLLASWFVHSSRLWRFPPPLWCDSSRHWDWDCLRLKAAMRDRTICYQM